jgi:hypothetical protein
MTTSNVFNAKSHPPTLVYDFTGFTRSDGEGNCRGSGVISEPTPTQLCAFGAASRAMRRPPLPQVANGYSEEGRFALARDGVIGAITAVGDGTPPRSDLEELPDRLVFAFFRFLEAELELPEQVGA